MFGEFDAGTPLFYELGFIPVFCIEDGEGNSFLSVVTDAFVF
jgi:hypothetical protein